MFVSTINFINRFPEKDILDIVKDTNGKYNIELSSGHHYEKPSEKVINELIGWSKRYGKKVLLHNFSPPEKSNILINLSNENEHHRKKVKDFIKKRIDFTEDLGMDYYSFHGGYTVDYKFGKKKYSLHLPKDETLDLFIEELRDLVKYAEKKKITIGIENHVVEKGNQDYLVFGTPDDFEILFDSIESKYLSLHLDLGHLKVSSKTYGFDKHDFINRFSEKIKGVHLHENDGFKDIHNKISSSSWFLDSLEEMPNLKYCILETNTKNDNEIDEMMKILDSEIL